MKVNGVVWYFSTPQSHASCTSPPGCLFGGEELIVDGVLADGDVERTVHVPFFDAEAPERVNVVALAGLYLRKM